MRGGDHVLCDACNGVHHLTCAGLEELPSIPWHCPACKRELQDLAVYDLTLDEPVMRAVYDDHWPDDERECQRVREAASRLSVSEDGKLLRMGDDGRSRVVPPIVDRLAIIEDEHISLGMVGGKRLYKGLRTSYWWPTLHEDCLVWATMACQKEKAVLTPPWHLFPIPKGIRPLTMWILDCMVGLMPSPCGYTAAMVGVDPFGKWIEGVPMTAPTSD